MSGKETRRSDTLIHWTGGKDIDPDYEDPKKPKYYQKCDVRRERYLERLKGTLGAGLWMKKKPVNFYSESGESFPWPYTCFTGMKPSESREHIERYGRLGFGFSRKLIMKWYGGPVLYLPGKQELDTSIGAHSQCANHFKRMFDVLEFLADRIPKRVSHSDTSALYTPREGSPTYHAFKKFIEAYHLQEFLETLDCEDDYRYDAWALFPKLLASIITIAIFVKEMSDEGSSAFELFDEEEWRLCYINGCDKFIETGEDDPPYKFPFKPCDLECLFLPDTKTKELALADKDISEWLGKNPSINIKCLDSI